MFRRWVVGVILATLAGAGFAGCAGMPATFWEGSDAEWASVEIRDGLTEQQSWREVVDVMAKKFELEIISKDGGYVRTGWIYTWWKQGKATKNYRVRAIVKFSPDWMKVDIKTEANFHRGGEWIVGFDTRLLETVKTDIMGVVGRTTR